MYIIVPLTSKKLVSDDQLRPLAKDTLLSKINGEFKIIRGVGKSLLKSNKRGEGGQNKRGGVKVKILTKVQRRREIPI